MVHFPSENTHRASGGPWADLQDAAYQRGWDAFAAAINGHGPSIPSNSTEALYWSEGFADAAADFEVWGFEA